MKSIILSCLAIAALATGAQAQGIGPEAGLNISNFIGFSNSQPLNSTIQNGVMAGIVAESPMCHNICMEHGLYYMMNGYRENVDNRTVSVHISTIELPVTVQFKARENAAGDRLFVGIGPYIALNFSGKQTVLGAPEDNKFLSVGSNNIDDIKAFDFGGQINAGYEVSNGFFIRAHAQIGFLNLKPYGDSNNALYNTNFGLSVGYLFMHEYMRNKDKMHHHHMMM